MEGDESKAAKALPASTKNGTDLIFTLGSRATEAAVKSQHGVPVIAGLILNAEDVCRSGNVCCVVLEFPLELQFQWISRMLPEGRHIGVLHGPGNQRKVEKAIEVARGRGITLHAKRVDTPSDLPDALNSMAKRVDALWGIPDDLVYTPQTAKGYSCSRFETAFRYRLSSAW